MASAEREPIMGAPGAEPPAESRAEPLVRGANPSPEAESFLRLGHPKEGANWWSDCHECHLESSCLVHHRRQLQNSRWCGKKCGVQKPESLGV